MNLFVCIWQLASAKCGYVFIFIHMHIYLHIHMNIHMYISICRYMHFYLCTRTHACTWHEYTRTCIYWSTDLSANRRKDIIMLFWSDCNTLQRTATHCNTLQHTATHCSTLHHTATHCNTLQHTATHCNKLQYAATQNGREDIIMLLWSD